MFVRRLIAPLSSLAFLILVVAAVPSAAPAPRTLAVTFESPAGSFVAGPVGADPFVAILPSGRIVRPTGTSAVVGMNALGVALTPDGRYAVVSDDDERQTATRSLLDPQTSGGYALAVVDTRTMQVVDRYHAPQETFFVGVVALRDPADAAKTLVLAAGGPSNVVYAFDLDGAGQLAADASHTIAIPTPSDDRFENKGRAFPSTILLSPDGRHAYVVDNLSDDVVTIDVATRSVTGAPVPVGFFPLGAALSRSGLLVANEGLMTYGVLPQPETVPRFATPRSDALRSSSLSVIGLDAAGGLAAVRGVVAMDRSPDGLREVGAAHPAAIVAMRTKPYAFVAMSNVDRVATIALGVQPRVVGGTELRLYDKGPYGTQPDALLLSPDEKRLYVALAGVDAIAVLDVHEPLHPHRLGLIPTGWYPTALAISRDGRSLFVANAKGFNHDRGFTGDQPAVVDRRTRILTVLGDSNAIWATLERIELARVDLRRTTRLALSYLRKVSPVRNDQVVPQRFGGPGSGAIKHVVMILEENKTYDSMLGDLTDASGSSYGPGDPSLVSFDRSVTPNLHALAGGFGLAGNFYADAEESDAGHQFVAAGIASVYTERTLLVKKGREPLVNKNEDPEDYPRAGYIFNSLALQGKTFRDYGDFIRLAGFDEGRAPDPKTDDPGFVDLDDQAAATHGLGGLYTLDVPAPAVLAGHVDLDYPGWNLRVRDVRRANEFIRDFDALVKADSVPAFTYIWLPDDHGGAGKDVPPLPEEVADGDRALGQIVDYLTHLPQWSSMAIFILPDDAQSGRDHVNEHRSYAIVVSPFGKRNYVGRRHQSTVSVLKTEEELLGLPALSLGDALATDLGDFFTATPDVTPFQHLEVPKQEASLEETRIAALLTRLNQSGPDADPRVGPLVELAREADALAKRRADLPDEEYLPRQRALYQRALALVR